MRRPLLLAGAGDVSSRDLPAALQSSMRVDALTRTVQWRGDRGWIRAAWGNRLVLKNGRAHLLPRPLRFDDFTVFFPEELLYDLSDIFSFVETSAGEELRMIETSAAGQGRPGAERDVPAPARDGPVSNGTRMSTVRPPIKTIVIDPGHGGGDPGAKGTAGAVEKDIVLAIGLEVALALRQLDPGLNVILTRSRDEFISLPDRARIANTRGGDVFVSIHANSVKRNAEAVGFEVYHLDIDGANDEARALAAMENSASQSGAPPARDGPVSNGTGMSTVRPPAFQDDKLKQILGDVMQLQYLNGSLELSKHVADALSGALQGASKFRGSKGAFFYVLKDVMAPAILVEVGFVTNEWEASFLQKPWYQRKIAGAIAEGVVNFKRLEENRTQTPDDASAKMPDGSSP